MARNWNFSRWRYMTMQAAMWIVLLGVLGLAGLQTASVHRVQSGILGRAIVDGTLTVRFPVNWRVVSDRIDQTLIYQAEEQAEDSNRKLTIIYQHVDRLMAPLQYMFRSELLPRNAGDAAWESITLDGWPAQSFHWQTAKLSAGGDTQTQNTFCICAVLPDYQTLTIRLDKIGEVTPADLRLFDLVLKDTIVSDLPAAAGSDVDFDGPIHISVPADFIVFPQTDSLRKDRTIVRQTADGGWIGVDLVPVLVNADLPVGWLPAALASREQFDPHHPAQSLAWLDASLVKEEAGRWRIDPQDPPESSIHRRAYLLAGPASQGLEIVLTAQSPSGDPEIDQAFAALSGKIQIAGSTDLNALLAKGASALPGSGGEPEGEFWWLWSRAGSANGWTHSSTATGGQTPVRDGVRIDWQSNVIRIMQRWGLSDKPAGMWSLLSRFDGPQQTTFTSATHVSDQIVTKFTVGPEQQKTTTLPLLPGFVSSAHLPRLLPAISQSPAAIWTDCFPGIEMEPLSSPVLMMVHSIASSDSTRCVEAEVNGTGEVSRWYFRPDGTLDHADFSGSVTLRTANSGEIQSAMHADPRLTLPTP